MKYHKTSILYNIKLINNSLNYKIEEILNRIKLKN